MGRNNLTIILLVFVAIWLSVTEMNWTAGFFAGTVMCLIAGRLIERFMGATAYYRRWYLMCRNELERIDPHNSVLNTIGNRISKKESWEN